MTAQTIERIPARLTFSATRVTAYLGAAALAVGVTWYGLAEHGVTTATAPATSPHLSGDANLRIFYRWMAGTFGQERLYDSLIILGFLCLAAVTIATRDQIGRKLGPGDRRQDLAWTAAFLVSTGAVVWITGAVFQLGAHRAVGLMASHSNPIQTTNSIAFTTQIVGDAFAVAAFTVTGAGLLLIAGLAAHIGARSRIWPGYTAVIAAVMLAVAATYAAGPGSLNDALLLAGGAVLLPGWLAWTGHRS